jgi:prepilin-type processing-associated H-X9-DG protein
LEVIYGAWAVPPMWMFFNPGPRVWGEPDGAQGIINLGNYMGPYAFHPGGVNTAFCDGSVRFLGEALEPAAFAGLLSRDGGEAVSE